MAHHTRSWSPNLLGLSLSRRDNGTSESRLNRGSTISQEDEAPSGLALKYIPTPLPSQMEFPSNITHGFDNAFREQRSAHLAQQTPRASHQQTPRASHQLTPRASHQQAYASQPERTVRPVYSQQNLQSRLYPSVAPSSSTLLTPQAAYQNDTTRSRTLTHSASANTLVGGHRVTSDQDGSIHEVLSPPSVHGPHTYRLENPCHCNNIICTLFGSPDSHLMNGPASPTRVPSILVVLGYWSFYLEGRTSSRSGGIKPIRVGDLITAIHESLHKPVIEADLNGILRPLTEADRYKVMQQMSAHVYARSGRHPDPGRLDLFQRVDYVARCNDGRTGEAMYVKRLRSDPAAFVVGLV